MEKLKFSRDIKAPKETVWKVLWDDTTYPLWTSVFSEGSKAVSDWKEGSKVLFVDATGDGMFSIIAKKTPNEFMSFKHLGEIKKGKEEKSTWSGALEEYRLQENAGVTILTVEIDITDEFKKYFSETFPKALDKVKEISEKQKVRTA